MEKKQKKSYNKKIKVIIAIIILISIIIILMNKNIQGATSNITLKVTKEDASVSYKANTGSSDKLWQGTCIAGNYIVICAVKADDTGNIFVFDKQGNQKQKIEIPNGGHHCNSITYDSNKSYIIISSKAKAPIAYEIDQSTGKLTKKTLKFNRTEQRSNGDTINATSIAYNPVADNFVVLYSYNSHFYIYSSSDFYNNNHTNATKIAYPCLTYNSSYYCQQSTAKNNFWYYLVGTKNSSDEWTNYIYIYDLLDNGQLVDIIQESDSRKEMEGITFPEGSGKNLYVSWHSHEEGTSYKKFLLYKTDIKSNDFYRYKATFNGNGGTNGTTISKYYKARTEKTLPLGTLSTPTRTGYIFDGWYTSASGGSKISSATTLTKDTTFYAHWNLQNYSITYNLNGGTATNPTNYNIASNNITLNIPTKTGYKFTGWTGTGLSGQSANVTIANGSTGNRVYTANWTPNTNTAYKVVHQRMNLNGSGYETVETENKTGTTGMSITPDVKNYTGFTSPNKQTVTIAADGSTTITYQYARNKYSYTLGSIPTVNTTGSTPTGSYYYGQTITLKAAVNNGYEWDAWISTVAGKKIEANTTFTMPAENVTMTPVVTVKNYTIAYNLNGGTQNSGNATHYNIESEDITLKIPTRTGYTFEGWTGTDLSTKTIYVTIPTGSTGDRTYVANWTQNEGEDNNTDATYIVIHQKMNVNGIGYTTEETEKLTAKVGTSVTPKLKDYSGFTNPNTQTKTVAADGSTTITYLYTRNKYEYTLKTSLGVDTTGSTPTGNYYFGTVITLKATGSNGYTWNKWESSNLNLASSQTKSNTTFTMPDGDIKMTPKVTPIKYTITYNLNGGTAINPESYTVESEKIILNNPQKEGYEFTGWTGSNGNTPQKEVIIQKGSIGDKNYIANWKPKDGIKYTVNHWLQNIDGDAEKHNDKNYTLRFSEELTEKIGNEVKPKTINYKGFTEPEQITIKIKSDDSQVVDYYYIRNKYKLTVVYRDKYSNDIIKSRNTELYYEQEYKLSVDLDNYTYLENQNKLEDAMPANNLEMNLYYARNLKDTITIKYINEETNEEIAQEERISGYEGKKYSTEVKKIEGYKINENKLPENLEGIMTKERIEVIYYYTKIINDNLNQEDSSVNNNESANKNDNTTNNYKDKTTANTIIPNTGIDATILILILTISIFGTISYIGYKKNN